VPSERKTQSPRSDKSKRKDWSRNLDWTFVHVPKTGGKAVQQSVKAHFGKNLRVHGHQVASVAIDSGGRIRAFAVVRNPWDRIISIFLQIYGKGSGANPKFAEQFAGMAHTTGFRTWALEVARPGLEKMCFGTIPATSSCSEYLDAPVQRIIHFENLEAELRWVMRAPDMEVIRVPEKYRRLATIDEYHSKETRLWVAERYAEDIARFGYEWPGRV
jgi:hypothetical protein